MEPAGRTIGQYLREEISGPIEADAMIGVKEAEVGRISKVRMLGFGFQFLQSLKPKILGRKIKHSFIQLVGRLVRIIWSSRHATTRRAPAPLIGMNGLTGIEIFNDRVVAMGETPSAAANCSARGLAKIAAMMAARGTWAENKVLSEEAWTAMHEDPVEADIGFGTTHFTQGGVNLFVDTDRRNTEIERALNQGREGFYGWMGFGGSIFQWHPQHEIGFGFVPTSLHALDILNERGKIYQAEVLRCVDRLNAERMV